MFVIHQGKKEVLSDHSKGLFDFVKQQLEPD